MATVATAGKMVLFMKEFLWMVYQRDRVPENTQQVMFVQETLLNGV